MSAIAVQLILTAFFLTACVAQTSPQGCGWCGMPDASDSPSWSTQIASSTEPGKRLQVEGTVYKEDEKTPAAGALVYVYHTNNKGVYPKLGNESGNGRRHGYLRGWMKTDAKGRYRFETIRPAPYETHGGEPAHIHYTIQAPGKKEYWINAAWFSDDLRVTKDKTAKLKRKGGFSNVMEVSKDTSGVWHGRRDIILATYD